MQKLSKIEELREDKYKAIKDLCENNGATHWKITFYKDGETVAETCVCPK